MPIAQIRDIDVFYEITGEGEPLVLVHGGLLNHFQWMMVTPMFAESFRVVTFDWRGHGQSTGDIVQDPFHVVEDLAALIEHLDIAPAHVAGQSGGGHFVLHLAAARPDLFRSLSVHEPASFGLVVDDPLGEAAWKVLSEVTSMFKAGDMEDALRVFVTLIGGDWALFPPPVQAIFLQNAHNYAGDWNADPAHAVWSIDIEALRRFPQPIQLTMGNHTAPVFATITETLATLLPAADRVVVEGGHGAMFEHPAEYAKALGEFIKNRASGAV